MNCRICAGVLKETEKHVPGIVSGMVEDPFPSSPSSSYPFSSIKQSICPLCFVYFVKKEESSTDFIAQSLPMGGGTFRDRQSHAMGSNAEQHFWDLCRSRNMLIRPSSMDENRKLHFDFVIFLQKHFVRVEVKSMKSRKRGQSPDPSLIYLEIQNIDGGKGWVFGQYDWIAFEQPGGFLLFHQDDIIAFVDYFYPKLPFVTESGIDFTLYGRKQRKDIMMLVPFAVFNSHMKQRIFL